MLLGVVERECVVELDSRFLDVSCEQEGIPHDAMTDHDRNGRLLLLCESQELRRKLAVHVPVERHEARDPDTVEYREQQQRVFDWLSERVGLFDQQVRPLRGRPGFWRSIAFDMYEGGYKRDLQLDLFVTQRGRGAQARVYAPPQSRAPPRPAPRARTPALSPPRSARPAGRGRAGRAAPSARRASLRGPPGPETERPRRYAWLSPRSRPPAPPSSSPPRKAGCRLCAP